MKRFIKFIAKHKICTFIVMILVVLSIPIIINESYKTGKGYVTMWEAADVLSFYGSFLSFAGTVVLGAIAIWQNNKAHKLNEHLQKLQQAEYISMVSVEYVAVKRIDSHLIPTTNSADIIDLRMDGFHSPQCYSIHTEIKNNSAYPIVQMQIHPGERTNGNCQLYGLKSWTDQTRYIPGNENISLTFIIPCQIFDYTQKYSLQLRLNFINVFDYATPADLYIVDLSKDENHLEYQYHLLKFIDVKPKD